MLLNEPGLIGPMRLKNRIIMAPMGTNYGTTDGFATDRDKRYYAERARGGVAMIVTEAMNISPGARNHHNSLCVFHDAFIPGLSAMVERHQGARRLHGRAVESPRAAAAPLRAGHGTGRPHRRHEPGDGGAGACASDGRDSRPRARVPRISPPAADRRLRRGRDPRRQRLSVSPVLHAAVQSAHRCVRRLGRESHAVSDRDGRPHPRPAGRLSGDGPGQRDGVRRGWVLRRTRSSRSSRRSSAPAWRRLTSSGGSNETPFLSRFCIQPPSFPRRCLEPYARPLKSALRIPVIIAGRIITPEDAETILQAGSADFISLGRALIADPHWCLKAFGAIDAPIRPCISCNVCLERLSLERDVACVQNPLVGTEFESLEALEPQLVRPRASAPEARAGRRRGRERRRGRARHGGSGACRGNLGEGGRRRRADAAGGGRAGQGGSLWRLDLPGRRLESAWRRDPVGRGGHRRHDSRVLRRMWCLSRQVRDRAICRRRSPSACRSCRPGTSCSIRRRSDRRQR